MCVCVCVCVCKVKFLIFVFKFCRCSFNSSIYTLTPLETLQVLKRTPSGYVF